MVNMKRVSRWSILLIDLIGGGLALACVGGFVWFTTLRPDQTAREVDRLNGLIRSAQRELSVMRVDRDRERSLLRARLAQLEESGDLPMETPVEEYFRSLSAMAKEYGLRVIRHNPLGHRTYPGLLERRYAYEITGATTDIMRFFQALERADFWADIGYLKITGTAAGARGERVASLTISVFSALPHEDDEKG
jgi:hypothetical protein